MFDLIHYKRGILMTITKEYLTINYEFRKKFQHLNFTLNYCYQCSTCTGCCPVAKITNGDFNPRKLIECALLGLDELLIDRKEPNAWLCVTCQKCVELCPQGVELVEIFDLIKNLCVEAGDLPEAYKSQAQTVYETGLAIPYTNPILKRRENLGLSMTKTADPLEIQTLLKTLEFDKRITIETNSPKEADEN
jgi:heterodisulfide reductase subunit C2